MKKTQIASAVLASALSAALLAGCGSTNTASPAAAVSTAAAAKPQVSNASIAATTVASVGTVDVSFDTDDTAANWKSGSYTTLDMSTGSTSSGSTSSGSMTITKSGIYEITGTLADGSLVVDVDKATDKGTVTLVLNNASITSAASAPIYIKDAKKVILFLEDGTTNTLSQGSGVTVDSAGEPSAALFSKADLTITGGGTLNVTSEYNDGITSKDTLKITSGTITVKAAGDGITGKDTLAVEKAGITVTAGKDGLRATNDTDAGEGSIFLKDGDYQVIAAGDAVQAAGVLQIDGGTFDLSSGGGYTGVIKTNSDFGGMGGGQFGRQTVQQTAATAAADDTSDSTKCLKAAGGILINGGTFTLSSADDGIHSDGDAEITGGTITVQAGDDGIHTEGALSVTGGAVTIQNSYEGVEGTTITVTGGDIQVTSSDDGFNINSDSGLLTLGGGTVYVNAGGDGLDSNGSIKMTGGAVTVDGPTDNGNGAIDYNGSFDISGGTLVASGSSGMAQTGSGSAQPALLMYYSSTQASGKTITVKDSAGSAVVSFTPAKQYNSAAITAPGLKTGQTYTLWSGDTQVVSFTISDATTYLSESGVTTNKSMGPGGGSHSGGPGGGFDGGAPGGN